jgi:hypothetical protein
MDANWGSVFRMGGNVDVLTTIEGERLRDIDKTPTQKDVDSTVVESVNHDLDGIRWRNANRKRGKSL